MSLADTERAAIRTAVAQIRKKVHAVEYHLDSTETVYDPIEALKEAQRASTQIITDLTLVIERIQARREG